MSKTTSTANVDLKIVMERVEHIREIQRNLAENNRELMRMSLELPSTKAYHKGRRDAWADAAMQSTTIIACIKELIHYNEVN